VYAAIETIVAEGCANVAQACRILDVNRPAFYAWKSSPPTVFEERDDELAPLIRVIFKKHRRRYGSRRIIKDLKKRGHVCSCRKVSNIMKTLHFKAIQPRSFIPKTTDSRHRLGYSPNLLLGADETVRLNQIWVGDITYLPVEGGTFCYVAVLMDLHSRRIVGWHPGDDMTESLVLRALRSAVKQRQPEANLIHHTDRGGQYAGNEYRAVLRRAGVLQSMSRAGNCYDNAFMESCFGTIKNELEMTDYEDSRAARTEIAQYIRYYNSDRRHSGIVYCSPDQFEQIINLQN
jgi:transposase InsO family protein